MTYTEELTSLIARCRKYVDQDAGKLLAEINSVIESPSTTDGDMLTSLLARCREHVETAGSIAEAKYEDIWNELYLDENLHKVIQETNHLLSEIDVATRAD